MRLSTVRMDSATTTGSRGFMTLYFSCKGIGNRSVIQQSSKGDKDLLKLYWNRVPVLFIWCPEGAVTKYDCRACQANRAVPVAGKLATVCSPLTNAVASSTSSLTDAVSKSLVTGSPIVLQEKNLTLEQWTARIDLIMKICCSYLTKVHLFNHEDIVLLFDQSAFLQKSCYNRTDNNFNKAQNYFSNVKMPTSFLIWNPYNCVISKQYWVQKETHSKDLEVASCIWSIQQFLAITSITFSSSLQITIKSSMNLCKKGSI
jgi:hypothetical protein